MRNIIDSTKQALEESYPKRKLFLQDLTLWGILFFLIFLLAQFIKG